MTTDSRYRLISLPALRQMHGITQSRNTLKKMMKAGTFPPRVMVGERCSLMWPAASVERYIALRSKGLPWTPADDDGGQP